MSTLDAIMIIEDGMADSDEQIVAAWQSLIDSGVVWSLQGSYGRTATYLIENGVCTSKGN